MRRNPIPRFPTASSTNLCAPTGTVSPYNPMTICPIGCPSMVTSINTFLVIDGLDNVSSAAALSTIPPSTNGMCNTSRLETLPCASEPQLRSWNTLQWHYQRLHLQSCMQSKGHGIRCISSRKPQQHKPSLLPHEFWHRTYESEAWQEQMGEEWNIPVGIGGEEPTAQSHHVAAVTLPAAIYSTKESTQKSGATGQRTSRRHGGDKGQQWRIPAAAEETQAWAQTTRRLDGV